MALQTIRSPSGTQFPSQFPFRSRGSRDEGFPTSNANDGHANYASPHDVVGHCRQTPQEGQVRGDPRECCISHRFVVHAVALRQEIMKNLRPRQ